MKNNLENHLRCQTLQQGMVVDTCDVTNRQSHLAIKSVLV